MALDSIEIKSFKSIVSQRLDFGQINVFIGANGSGKSNVLEAIGMLSGALSGTVDYAALAQRGVRRSAPEVFKSSFRGVARKSAFSLEGKFGGIRYQVNIRPDSEDRFTYAAETIETPQGRAGRSSRGQNLIFNKKLQEIDGVSPVGPGAGIVPVVRLANRFQDREVERLMRYAIYSPSAPILRGVSHDGSGKKPLGLYGGGLATALRDILGRAHRKSGPAPKQAADFDKIIQLLDWLDAVDTTANISPKLQSSAIHAANRTVRYTDRFMRTTFNKLYAYDASEGALCILFALALLLHKDAPDIFALDNVGCALNPTLARELMLHLTEAVAGGERKQLFVATHNPTSLDSIDLFDPRQRLFVVERDAVGRTEIKRISPPRGFTRQKWIKKHGGMRLSQIWLSGSIGGLGEEFEPSAMPMRVPLQCRGNTHESAL